MVDATKVPYVCWHVTYRCNLRCSFCYAPKEGHEPDREEFLAVGDALAAGCERISLMGGEPLLNPHVPEVAARLHGRCGLSLVTNGTLLTPELVTALAPRLDRMSVSLDAVSQEVATACRGPRYDMRRVTEGVRLVVRAGLPLKVNTLVTVRNAGHIAEILRFLVSLGAPVDWKLAEPAETAFTAAREIAPLRVPRTEFLASARSLADAAPAAVTVRTVLCDDIGDYVLATPGGDIFTPSLNGSRPIGSALHERPLDMLVRWGWDPSDNAETFRGKPARRCEPETKSANGEGPPRKQ
jgi:molybdenum cofactor biosynthesis enzyme MoaA